MWKQGVILDMIPIRKRGKVEVIMRKWKKSKASRRKRTVDFKKKGESRLQHMQNHETQPPG